jgi:hypothetical protein
VATSPAKSTRASSPAKAKQAQPQTSTPKKGKAAAAASSSAFDFDEQEEDDADAEMEEEAERKGSTPKKTKKQSAGAAATAASGGSAKKKAAAPAAAAAAKAAAPSPRKSTRGGERKAAAEEEEEESKETAEDASMLDAEYSLALSLPGSQPSAGVSSGGGGGGGGLSISKDEADKLLDAPALKAVMSHKDELLKRLKKLSLVLAKSPQSTSGTVSAKIRALANALVDRQIIKNKSQEVRQQQQQTAATNSSSTGSCTDWQSPTLSGSFCSSLCVLLFFLLLSCPLQVRAISACCIADLFRMCAPALPFADEQLRLAFELITGLLANLSAQTHPDFNRYFMLLEALVQVRFANTLCNRSAECDEIMRGMFELFFALAKVSEQHSKLLSRQLLPALILKKNAHH